jgi:ATP-dependent DNA ligase
MIRITIDTDRPEYAGSAKWPKLARLLRDLADKCEHPMPEQYKSHMILMDAYGQHTGQMIEVEAKYDG